jgi:DNA-binding transcriptional MerR regulator
MELVSLSELVRRSGFAVDTIRYYQRIGLLDAPRRRGRNALYNQAHLNRLRKIRSMARQGLPLKVIKAMLPRSAKSGPNRALIAAVRAEANPARYTGEEFAKALGIPRGLLDLIEGCALRELPQDETGAIAYSEADLIAARGVVQILDYGIPVTRLLALALKHHSAAAETADDAIELFDEYIRSRHGNDRGAEAIADTFREMFPLVVSLIAHHFHRLLVGRALKRLKQSGDEEAFNAARQATAAATLDLPLR